MIPKNRNYPGNAFASRYAIGDVVDDEIKVLFHQRFNRVGRSDPRSVCFKK
jgi:hypothetical protein